MGAGTRLDSLGSISANVADKGFCSQGPVLAMLISVDLCVMVLVLVVFVVMFHTHHVTCFGVDLLFVCQSRSLAPGALVARRADERTERMNEDRL